MQKHDVEDAQDSTANGLLDVCWCHGRRLKQPNPRSHGLLRRTRTGRTHLAPTRALLEAITRLMRRFTNGQILIDIAAVPVQAGELHAERIILCERILRRPASLPKCGGPDQKVGACAVQMLPSAAAGKIGPKWTLQAPAAVRCRHSKLACCEALNG